MSTASGKYVIIEADTLETRKRYRMFIEEQLQKPNLPPALRAELETALKQALIKEADAERALDESKKKKGEAGGGETGEGEGQGSGGEDGDSEGDGEGEGGDSSGGIGEFEMFNLLFFLSAALKYEQEQVETAIHAERSALEPLAAATLLLDRIGKAAHIEQPYHPEQGDAPNKPSDLLSALEQHALSLGAQTMHLKVHIDAVDLFKKKFGYAPLGETVKRRGTHMQRMRKTLAHAQTKKNSAT